MSAGAATTYKKRNGQLAVATDRTSLSWTETGTATPAFTFPVADIANLQQTPATNPKVALKVIIQPAGSTTPENHVFSFTSLTAARADQEAITEILTNAIAALKTTQAQSQLATRANADQALAGQSAAMAIAQAASSSSAKPSDGWYDDARLKSDIELQRSLLDANPTLKQRFNESLVDKPESMSVVQFSAQFWSTRLHLLRAHAIEKAQAQGDYNVLPEIKFKRVAAEKEGEPDKLMLNLAKEQVKLIFKQYPIVREAYNDNVPQIDQNAFWSRFFMSRLLKKLKGEKITDSDPPDAVFDKYLEHREAGISNTGHVPHFIDLEGNEQNHSQRKGNRPDETMRPGSFDKVPILRVLNNLSEKMMARVAPADGEAHAPVGLDEETFNQLQLRDLQNEAEDNRVILNINDQKHILTGKQQDQRSTEAELYSKQDPETVLAALRSNFTIGTSQKSGLGVVDLDEALGMQSDSGESDDEMDETTKRDPSTKKRHRIGSKDALVDATNDMIASVSTRRAAESGDPTGTFGLPQDTFDLLTMVNNTTVEFLHYFWMLFLSGDGSRSSELARLVETLDKSIDRIVAVSDTAAKSKASKLDALRAQMQGLNQKSNKRRRLELETESVGGGKEVVDDMIAPTVKALATATGQYRKALEEQTVTSN